MRNKTVIYAQRNFAMDSVDLYLMLYRDGYKKSYMVNAVFKELEEGVTQDDSSPIHLEFEQAQLLMDQLWNVGIRPTDNRDRSEVINAKDQHIDDLRLILQAFIEATKK